MRPKPSSAKLEPQVSAHYQKDSTDFSVEAGGRLGGAGDEVPLEVCKLLGFQVGARAKSLPKAVRVIKGAS